MRPQPSLFTVSVRRSAVIGLVIVGLVVATAPAVTTRMYASDEVQYYVYLRSLWFDGDLSFDNEYRHLYDAGVARTDGFRETLLERTTATGRRPNFGTIGCAILWAPFYAVGDAWAHVARWRGSSEATDGYSHPYIAAACYASATYGWLALLLSGLAAAQVVRPAPRRHVWLGGPILVLLGTPLVFYIYVAPPFAHATSAFAVSAFTFAWLRLRRRWSIAGTAALGALGAVVVLVREQDALVLAGPVIDFVWSWACGPRTGVNVSRGTQAPALSGRHFLAAACAGAAAFATVCLPQIIAYLVLNGRLGPSPLLTRKMSWWSPHAPAVLLSPEHGLLCWTPLVGLAIAGLLRLALGRKVPGAPTASPEGDDGRIVGICLLAMVAGHVYVTGCVASWTAAGAFGQRRFVALTPMFVIGLAVVWATVKGRAARLAVGLACGLCVWWNLGLMMQFGGGMMDRQRLDIARNARVTFLVLPREAPGLAYRYLFDRPSFYRPTLPGT